MQLIIREYRKWREKKSNLHKESFWQLFITEKYNFYLFYYSNYLYCFLLHFINNNIIILLILFFILILVNLKNRE